MLKKIAYSSETVKCHKCKKEFTVNFYDSTARFNPICRDCKSGKTKFKKEGYRNKEGDFE